MRIWVSWHWLLTCPGARIYQLNCAEHRFVGAFMDHGDAVDFGRIHRVEHHPDSFNWSYVPEDLPTASEFAARTGRGLGFAAVLVGVPGD